MGFALAEEATRRGAEVTVVAANVALERAENVRYVDVATAAELATETKEAFHSADVLLMAAAVADFRPANPVAGKLSKAGRERLGLELEPTEDVLTSVGTERRPGQLVIGFAAEHGEDVVDRAGAKLRSKGLDAVVVNDVSRPDIGFDADQNEVTIVTAREEISVPRASKRQVASAIVDAVERLRVATTPEGAAHR
jgi:phosphopantothenoylcysteine decarboxylase/phosphopantothenate--cysteine ligase